MAIKQITVCDKCYQERPLRTYLVEQGLRRASADLCEECAAPQLAFLDEWQDLSVPTEKRPVPERRTRYNRIVTIKELEQLKKAGQA